VSSIVKVHPVRDQLAVEKSILFFVSLPFHILKKVSTQVGADEEVANQNSILQLFSISIDCAVLLSIALSVPFNVTA